MRIRQESELDSCPQGIQTSVDELTLRLVDERIKQTTDPILRRVEKICALLVGGTAWDFAGNSETSDWRRDNASTSPSRNRYDTGPSKVHV